MTRSPALKVLDLLREHLISVQYADSAYGTEVSNVQASLLSEIVRRTDPTIHELSQVIGTTTSSVSRQLTKLSEAGYLTIVKDRTDSRKNNYTLTSKGMQFIRLHWRKSEEFTQQGVQSLTPGERATLEEFLLKLLGHDPRRDLIALPHESLVTLSLRALAFAHGVLSDSFMGSGHPNRVWLILSEILYNGRSPGEIAELLHSPPSTVSLRLKALVQDGLIVNERDTNDRRARNLHLTSCGHTVLCTVEACAEQVLGTPLKAVDATTQQRYLDVFAKYVRGVGTQSATGWRAALVKPADIAALAIAAASYIASSGSQYRHSGFLLHPKNLIVRLTRDGATPLLLELVPVGSSRARLVHVFHGTLDDAGISLATLSAMIHELCDRRLVPAG